MKIVRFTVYNWKFCLHFTQIFNLLPLLADVSNITTGKLRKGVNVLWCLIRWCVDLCAKSPGRDDVNVNGLLQQSLSVLHVQLAKLSKRDGEERRRSC